MRKLKNFGFSPIVSFDFVTVVAEPRYLGFSLYVVSIVVGLTSDVVGLTIDVVG